MYSLVKKNINNPFCYEVNGVSVTVEEILKSQLFKEAKVHTGRELLTKQHIDWVSVIEIPVEDFVRPNEFVLTTGIGTQNKFQLLLDFTKEIIKSNASVLAFSTGKFINEIPNKILELAEDEGLIILEIPWSVRFADIVQVVMEKIQNYENHWFQRSNEIWESLLNCVLNGNSIEDIVKTLYLHLKIPIAVIDEKKLLRANMQFFSESFLFQKTEVLENDSAETEYLYSHPIIRSTVNDQECVMFPIFSNQKKQGFFLIKPFETGMITDFQRRIIDYGITALGLYFLQENAVEMTEIRLKENFLLTIARKRARLTDKEYMEGELLGYDLKREYICLIGKINYKEDEEIHQFSLEQMKYLMQNILYDIGISYRQKLMYTFDEDLIIIYVENYNEGLSKEWVDGLINIIDMRIQEHLPDIFMSWGISYTPNSEESFSKSYEEAKAALHIGKKEKQKRTFYNDTKLNRLLLSFAKHEDIMKILDQTVQPLLDYDQKRNADLVKTFVVYNQMKGNVSQTARELNLHRQSLLYRLRKIESLTGLQLGNSDDLFLLEVAVRALLTQNNKI